jgi:hypothetical protein
MSELVSMKNSMIERLFSSVNSSPSHSLRSSSPLSNSTTSSSFSSSYSSLSLYNLFNSTQATFVVMMIFKCSDFSGKRRIIDFFLLSCGKDKLTNEFVDGSISNYFVDFLNSSNFVQLFCYCIKNIRFVIVFFCLKYFYFNIRKAHLML